jgi:hypothetical protein
MSYSSDINTHSHPALSRSSSRWPSSSTHVAVALRHFRLRSDCTIRDVRRAFLQEYAPLCRKAAKGGRNANNACRKLVRLYRSVLLWIQQRPSSSGLVAARGALHSWEW